MLEIWLGDTIIRFAVICADTCAGTDQLINQTIIYRAPGNLFCEKDHRFTESCRSLL